MKKKKTFVNHQPTSLKNWNDQIILNLPKYSVNVSHVIVLDLKMSQYLKMEYVIPITLTKKFYQKYECLLYYPDVVFLPENAS